MSSSLGQAAAAIQTASKEAGCGCLTGLTAADSSNYVARVKKIGTLNRRDLSLGIGYRLADSGGKPCLYVGIRTGSSVKNPQGSALEIAIRQKVGIGEDSDETFEDWLGADWEIDDPKLPNFWPLFKLIHEGARVSQHGEGLVAWATEQHRAFCRDLKILISKLG
jgi:hypothetical protein